jgi:hypothetical protein
MALPFTFSYVANGVPNFRQMEVLSDGRFRDLNGNSYDADELNDDAKSEGSFVVQVSEGDVDGWTVGEVKEDLESEALGLTMLFLTTDVGEATVAGSFEISFANDPARGSYGSAGLPDGEVYLLDEDDLTVSVSCELDDAYSVAAEA